MEKDNIDYHILPEHIRGGVQRYIEYGITPGSFLSAVICNDLKESFGCADHINTARMHDIVSFFYNEAPSTCWGSQQIMDEWIEAKSTQRKLKDVKETIQNAFDSEGRIILDFNTKKGD